jgi:hypothetical protein
MASPGYRRLWAARTVSQWGDIAQFTVVSLLVYHQKPGNPIMPAAHLVVTLSNYTRWGCLCRSRDR